MTGSKLFLSVALVAVMLTAGCKEDPEAAANRLIVESSSSLKEYDSIAIDDNAQLERRLSLINAVIANLDRIVAEYPESSIAVELSTQGATKGINRTDLVAKVNEIEAVILCRDKPTSRPCLLMSQLEDAVKSGAELHQFGFISLQMAAGGNDVGALKALSAMEKGNDRALGYMFSAYTFAGLYDQKASQDAIVKLAKNDLFSTYAKAIQALIDLKKADIAGRYLDAAQMVVKFSESNDEVFQGLTRDVDWSAMIVGLAEKAIKENKMDIGKQIADLAVDTASGTLKFQGDPMPYIFLYDKVDDPATAKAIYDASGISESANGDLRSCKDRQDMPRRMNFYRQVFEAAAISEDKNLPTLLEKARSCFTEWYWGTGGTRAAGYFDWAEFADVFDFFMKLTKQTGRDDIAKVNLKEFIEAKSRDGKPIVDEVWGKVALVQAYAALGDNPSAVALALEALPSLDDISLNFKLHETLNEISDSGFQLPSEIIEFLKKPAVVTKPKFDNGQEALAFDRIAEGKPEEAMALFAEDANSIPWQKAIEQGNWSAYGLDISRGLNEFIYLGRNF